MPTRCLLRRAHTLTGSPTRRPLCRARYVDVLNTEADAAEKEAVAVSLARVGASCGSLHSTLRGLLKCEFVRHGGKSSLLRGSSIAVRVQSFALAMPEHQSYLASVVGPFVRTCLEDASLSLEIDPR